MEEEDIFKLTPIVGRTEAGLFTSDSEASPPQQRRFDPHTPRDPRPRAAAASRPAGDIPTPLDPHAGAFFFTTPGDEKRELDDLVRDLSSSLLASVGADDDETLAEPRAAEDAQESLRRPSSHRHGKGSARLGQGSSPAAGGRTPRAAPEDLSASRTHRAQQRRSHSRKSSRAARANDAEDDELAGNFEPMLHTLSALTRELREAFASEMASPSPSAGPIGRPAPFGYSGVGYPGVGYPGVGYRGAGYPALGYPATASLFHARPRPIALSALGGYGRFGGAYGGGSAWYGQHPSSSAMRSTVPGSAVHRSSFAHGGQHFYVTVTVR